MRRVVEDFFSYGNALVAALAVVAAAALLSAAAVTSLTPEASPQADIRIEPASGTYTAGDTFTVAIVVDSTIPVNVFAGELRFSPTLLKVQSIDYNTSIAELWVERPWYSNGDGTLNFAGGTTKPGGFTGSDSLLTVTFTTLGTGEDRLALAEARILQHDGLGTDVALDQPIDALFTVTAEAESTAVIAKSVLGTEVAVLEKPPSTDLNEDGRQTVADISIFMTHLLTGNKRSDFNQDGKVNTADLSIIMQAK